VELRNLENGVDPADTDAADTQHGNDHGNKGFSKTAKRARGNIHQATDEISQADETEPEHAVADSFRRVSDVQRQQGRSEEIAQGTHGQTHHSHTAETDPQGLGHPFVLPCTGILAHEVHGSLMEGIQRNVDKAFDVACGSVAGHEYIAKGIDGGLNQHIGNGKQGTLDTGGQADPQHLGKLQSVKPHFLQFQVAGIGTLHQGPYYQCGRNALRNGGSQSNTGHIHMQQCHKDNVQNHIDHTGKAQVDKGAFGITGGTQNGGAEVVHHGESNTGKVDLHVLGGQGQHRIRGAHPVQESAGEAHTYDGQDDAADQRRRQGSVNGVVHHGIFPAAQRVGDGNACANGKSYEEVDHQIGDGSGSSHSSNTDTAAEPSHDYQVGSVKEELEKTCQDNGNGVENNIGQQRPCEHTGVQTFQKNPFFM